MIIHIAANWRKVFIAAAVGMSVLVGVLAAIHIYGAPISGPISVARGLLLIVGCLVGFSGVKPAMFDHIFGGLVKDNELFAKIREFENIQTLNPARVQDFKSVAAANRALFSVNWAQLGIPSPMERVLKMEKPELALALLECGSDPFERMSDGTNPLEKAIMDRSRELANALGRVMKNQPAAKLAHHGVSRATVAIACGELEMLKACDKAEMEKKDTSGFEPIHHAIKLGVPKEFVQCMIDAGVNLNTKLTLPNKGGQKFVVVSAQLAAIFAKAYEDESVLLTILSSGKAKIAADGSGEDAVQLAIAKGLMKSVKLMESTYDWSTIHSGKTALDFAKDGSSLPMMELVTKNMQSRGLISGGSSAPAASAKSSPSSTSTMIANRMVDLEEIDMKVSMSLDGLVDMESFGKDLAQQLFEFQGEKPKKSRGIVISGDASVGKSSIGKRLSGLLESSGTPGLDVPEIPFEYHSLADGRASLPNIIDNASAGAVLFIDEIDKFFDPATMMVSDQEAMKIKTQIITNWDRKPIFWIFAGSFIKLRGKSELNGKMLLSLLGSELNSRLEFVDWKIKPWSQEKIYAAAKHHITEDFGNNFDDKSIGVICEKALEADGGFREFEKHANSLYRMAQKQGTTVTLAMTNEYFKNLEGQS